MTGAGITPPGPAVTESERRLMHEVAELNRTVARCETNLAASRKANTRMRAELRKRQQQQASPWTYLPWRGYVT